jgi:hypothetical protein
MRARSLPPADHSRSAKSVRRSSSSVDTGTAVREQRVSFEPPRFLERQLQRGLPGVYEAVISGHRESPPVRRIGRSKGPEVTGDGPTRQAPITRNEGVPGSSPGVGLSGLFVWVFCSIDAEIVRLLESRHEGRGLHRGFRRARLVSKRRRRRRCAPPLPSRRPRLPTRLP